MLLYGNSCDLLVNLSTISLICGNGNRYITVICVSLGNELELSVVDFINAQTFARHILPSPAVLVLNLLNSICICTAYCNRCFCTSVCIVIGGNTYGKFFCFTGFHSSTIKAGNGNGSRYSIFVHGIVNLVVCYIIRFRVNHSSSILCGIPSDEHFSIFCRLANTIDLFLCQMFLAPNLFNCFCVTTICKSTTIRVKNHIAIIVDTLIIIGK